MYGLTCQIRRSSVSIEANLAEGCGRRSDREFRRFLQIARGSASELDYHLLLARDLRFSRSVQEYTSVQAAVVEVQRMLTALVKSLTPQAPKSKPNPEASNTQFRTNIASSQRLGASGSPRIRASLDCNPRG